MGGIVIELQREALDEKNSIESLIRKAYLVAKKLKLKEFEEWLNQEQNGYKKEIPEYRNITGEIKAWNPYHGWIPMILSAKVADIVSRRPIPNSISSLLDVYNSSEDTSVLAKCIRQFDIEVKMIEIETDLRDTLIEAQKRQRMVNA